VEVNWAAFAAFAAAGFSLVNVAVGAQFVRRGRLDQWRRDEELPIIARILTGSRDVVGKWQAAGLARRVWTTSITSDPSRASEDKEARDEASEHWRVGSDLFEKLRFESAQLDLVAGGALRQVVAALVLEHESIRHWIRPASGADDWFELLYEHGDKVLQLHDELIKLARIDLGVDSLPKRWRGLFDHGPAST
jgi:hypothetical protein